MCIVQFLLLFLYHLKITANDTKKKKKKEKNNEFVEYNRETKEMQQQINQ